MSKTDWRRMIKMPDGEFVEHQLTVMRLNKDNPREVTLVFPEDVCELSHDARDNHFLFAYVRVQDLPTLQQDSLP